MLSGQADGGLTHCSSRMNKLRVLVAQGSPQKHDATSGSGLQRIPPKHDAGTVDYGNIV